MKRDLVYHCVMCGGMLQRLIEELRQWGGTLEDARTNISPVDDYKRVRCDCSGRPGKKP